MFRTLLFVPLAIAFASAQTPAEEATSIPTFGVTVVAPFGFCGRLFELDVRPYSDAQPPMATSQAQMDPMLGSAPDCSVMVPRFDRMRPLGRIYTTKLNVTPRDFSQGFPGVTNRYEWFAIDYTARIWIETPGKYSFAILSDDGSTLDIDEHRVITNDCQHPPRREEGRVVLDGGLHDIRLGYFQGPRLYVALVFWVKPPDGKWRLFNTDDYRPPSNPADWKYSNPGNLDTPQDPCSIERHPQKLLKRR